MKMSVLLLLLTLILMPAASDARCRTIGESASLGSEYGMFPMDPAVRLVHAGQERESILMQWAGYGLGVPLFFVSVPFGMAGAVVGAASHPWTRCMESGS
ncbi:hypothetical protein DNFV4_01217 [Nitrospira tepida]|uniref:Uncharacterized protein n=1 Tax=Nitrospira tepida TaxID=2973512 RepID=A0AA86T5L7_9BACT|nr:hypothetical protein [Nitrospira tepida]CAI4030787.1 hypothetical protein DNFV4_01217 [Nitrospira tepida]